MLESDLVTVYITTKNRLNLFKRAINSVFEQTYKNIEIIVVDDGSTDGTKEYLISEFSESKTVRFFINSESRGACYARNIAIKNANGRYITGLDDDDEFVRNRIEVLLENYNNNLSFVCSNFLDIYSGRSLIGEKMKSDSFRGIDDLKFYNGSSNQIFTETYKLIFIGGFDESFQRLQDWDTWFRLCKEFGSFLKLKAPLYLMHHEHEQTRVSSSYAFDRALCHFLNKHNDMYNPSEMIHFEGQIKCLKKEVDFIYFFKLIPLVGFLRASKWYIVSIFGGCRK